MMRRWLHYERLDPEGKRVTHCGAENSHFFADRRQLAGLTLEQVRDAVQALPFVFTAFTEDEVRCPVLPKRSRPAT